MNIWSLIDSGELKPVSEVFCKEKVWIVDVGPELAKKLLEFNFADNRSFSQEYVNKLSAEMKAGRWGFQTMRSLLTVMVVFSTLSTGCERL